MIKKIITSPAMTQGVAKTSSARSAKTIAKKRQIATTAKKTDKTPLHAIEPEKMHTSDSAIDELNLDADDLDEEIEEASDLSSVAHTQNKPYSQFNAENRTELVNRFTPLVRRIAHHVMGRLPSSVQVEDVVQNGMLGLLDALERFQDGMGAQFETYAAQRIRGAILDGLRENDWLPRSARRDMRRIESTLSRLSQSLGRPPSEQEVADELQVPLTEYHKMLLGAKGHQMIYAEDIAMEGGESFLERHSTNDLQTPLDALLEKGLRSNLLEAIERLPEREKLVMSLYYEREFNLREIGAVLGVTESRVCQLHSQAVSRIRATVADLNTPAPHTSSR